MFLLTIIITPILIYLINYICLKNSFLLSYTGKLHQKFAQKESVPLTGGIILLVAFVTIFNQVFYNFHIYLFLIFLIGFFSDSNLISSPKLRFFFQILLILIFLQLEDINISSTRIIFLDLLLQNKLYSLLFTAFCMAVMLNGTNFIDGLNTLAIGYYLILSLILIKIDLLKEINIDISLFSYWSIILGFLYLFNLKKRLFLGDSGAYILGFIYSFLLLSIFNNNQNISPFFIILLLWYPCFENLFSIIRKLRLNKSPILPDSNHFHQLLYFYLKKQLKLSNYLSNNLSANMINLYNLSIFIFASKNIYNTQFQIILIFISIFLYSYIYLRIFIYKYRK